MVTTKSDGSQTSEGRRAADERGLRNIRWVHARAEDLPGAAPGPYRLVTFGQSLHWTDEQRVMETVYDLLEPEGALAMVVHTWEGRPEPPTSPGVRGNLPPWSKTTSWRECYTPRGEKSENRVWVPPTRSRRAGRVSSTSARDSNCG